METKKKKPGEPVTASGVTIIPVVETSFYCFSGTNRTVAFSGMVRPVQVVIRDKNGTHAFTCEGDPTSLSDLIRGVPGLENVLDAG